MKRTSIILAGAATAATLAVGNLSGVAMAATTTTAPPPPATVGCVQGHRTLSWVYENMSAFIASGGCAANGGGFEVGLNEGSGPAGPRGPAGPAGSPGPQGPSGVQALAVTHFTEHDGIATGGSFLGLSTEIGTASLAAGTYQICVNGKVEQPTATASGAQISAQLFLYDQAKNADFAGDLLNVSTPTQGGTTHDAYLNGCTLVTEASPVTLHLYAFGYDSDTGSGEYNLMAGTTVSSVKLTPAA